jgi:hypothetical protein
MKRFILAAFAITVLGTFIAPAFADEPNLKTADGVKKFWEQREKERGGGEGGGN